jgi:hypothetical protein
MAHKRGKAKTSAAKGKAAKGDGAASAAQPALKAASSGGATRLPPKSVQAASP